MMLKHGKRELRESTAAQARKKMKRTLLYTYFTSLACLVLCCAMFLGTTMAWFSDDVTNSGNVIQVGTLAAEVYHVQPAAGAGEEDTETSLNEKPDYTVFDNGVWAPGGDQKQILKIVNKGDLDFKYNLSLLLSSLNLNLPEGTEARNVTAAQQALLNSFEVYVYPGQVAPELNVDNIATTPAESANKWVPCGTLANFLPGTSVSGAEGTSQLVYKEIPLHSGTLEPNVTINEEGAPTEDSVQYVTVAIRMVDTKNTDLMGQSFTISVKLVATQLTASETADE